MQNARLAFKDDPFDFFEDQHGRVWKVPSPRYRIGFKYANHRALRQLIDHRDGGRCTLCHTTENLELDHIVPYVFGGLHRPENLQLLCQPHNLEKEAQERRIMGKYRKVDPYIWNDGKFRQLTDKGKLSFIFLLTHPHMTMLGAMRGTIPGLASEIRWPEKAFAEAFGEAFAKAMVKADLEACFIWLPNFLKYNKPESPNVVKSWADALDLLPECGLKNELIQHVKAFVEGLPKAFAEALPEAFLKPLPNQEQEQEQEQEYKNICIGEPAGSDEKGPVLTAKAATKEVFDYWLSFPKLHQHRSLTKTDASHIHVALQHFKATEIKLAIEHYSQVLSDQTGKYWLTHKWTIGEFLSRESGKWLTLFCDTDWEPQFLNDKSKRQGNGKQEAGRAPFGGPDYKRE